MSQQLPDFMQEQYLTGIIRTTEMNRQYIGLRWFPFEDTPSDEFRVWVQLDENPLAPFVAIDSETPIIPADMFNLIEGGVAYVRFKARFSENDLRIFTEIPVYGSGTNVMRQMQDEGERKIMSKVEMLSQSIDARLEWMRLEAMQGSISYSSVGTAGNVQFTVNMGGTFHGSTNRKAASPLWDASSPTPVQDLEGWISEVEEVTGVAPTVLACSNRVLRYLALSNEIRQLWAGQTSTGVTPPIVSRGMVAGALSIIGIEEVIRYNANYSTRTEAAGSATKTNTRFLPDYRLLLLPPEPLGTTKTAPAAANDFRTEKFAWTKRQEDPWVVEVGAGIYAFPFMENNQHKVLEATVLSV